MSVKTIEDKQNEARDLEAAKATEANLDRVHRARGFAAMDRAKVKAIASLGGKAAHAAGTAHRFTKEEAAAAGRKGGLAPKVRGPRGPKVKDIQPPVDA